MNCNVVLEIRRTRIVVSPKLVSTVLKKYMKHSYHVAIFPLLFNLFILSSIW